MRVIDRQRHRDWRRMRRTGVLVPAFARPWTSSEMCVLQPVLRDDARSGFGGAIVGQLDFSPTSEPIEPGDIVKISFYLPRYEPHPILQRNGRLPVTAAWWR
jgi:hypothetical protein